jgi:ribosomal protein S18 acetylase RimI-like enzyme
MMTDFVTYIIGGVAPVVAHLGYVLIGGLLAEAVRWLVKWRRNRALNKKYPIKGEYIAHTGDRRGNELVRNASVISLMQHGPNIQGYDTRNDKTWKLEGILLSSGDISGNYIAQTAGDLGVGTFYLKRISGDLEGAWCGYDHENKQTTSGTYTFRRTAKVEIIGMQEVHKAGISNIASSQFGPGYVSDADLDNGDKRFVLVGVLSAEGSTQVVGFAIGEIADISDRYQVRTRLPDDVRRAANSGKLGVIKTIAIADRYEGRGIGNQIFNAMERMLQSRGADMIVVPAWKSSRGIHIKGLLDHNGYIPFLTCPRYWKEQCDKSEFVCNDRQQITATGEQKLECICDLVWYKKALPIQSGSTKGSVFNWMIAWKRLNLRRQSRAGEAISPAR